MKELIEIRNFRYQLDMGLGSDIWRPIGNVYGHPHYDDGEEIMMSLPIIVNVEQMMFRTVSGNEYKIVSFGGKNKKEILTHLQDDCKRGSFKRS